MSADQYMMGGYAADPLARQMAQQALDAQAGSKLTYRHTQSSGLVLKIYTDSSVTTSTGAVVFALPAGFFPNAVTWAGLTAVRNSTDPTSATFAQLRTCSTSTVTGQVFESKTTGVLLLNTMVEGVEAAPAGITVLLACLGY